MSQYIVQSELLNDRFDFKIIDIKSSNEIGDIEKFRVKKLFTIFKIYASLCKHFIYYKPQLVYISLSPTGIPFIKDSIIVLLAKLFRVKILVHLHGKGIGNNKKFIYKKLYRIVFNKIFCICLSKKLTSEVERFNLKKIYILNNGIESIEFQKNNNSPSELSTIRILFLSNLIKEKGIFTFLNTCAKLKSLSIKFEATIIGKPFDVTDIDIDNFTKEHQLVNSLFYLGSRYGAEKFEIIKRSHVLIFPTSYKNEAFPLVLLEALQFGLVPITTDEGGITDIIENNVNGFIVHADDSDQIAESIKYLQNNPLVYHKLSERGIQQFNEKFKIETFENNLSNIFNDALQEY